jgi:hypothetical protein
MAAGPHTGSERQGAGHAGREDGPGRCGWSPVSRLEPEKRGEPPTGRGRGEADVPRKTQDYSDRRMPLQSRLAFFLSWHCSGVSRLRGPGTLEARWHTRKSGQ